MSYPSRIPGKFVIDEKARQEIRTTWETRSYKTTHGTFAKFLKETYGASRAYGYVALKGGSDQFKEHIPSDLRWKIWERDDFTCKLCGVRRHLSVHHIKPEHKGGTLKPSNLITLCRHCNSRVHIKELSFPIWPDVVVTTG
jgi:hypothetical protein